MNLTAIIIIAILASMVVSIVKTVKRNNQVKFTDSKFKEYETQVEQKLSAMQQRIEVLEKIVTDEKYNLNKEFENLKK
uniref:hypothetical protein n=1 Tax=Ningiella ruwaisensis TaxID=2364274 RepID=UPI0010A09B48|nr:hypothetical protein [Ningiella ruwaisensis]